VNKKTGFVGAGVDYGTSRVAFAIPAMGVFEDVVLKPGDNLGALDVISEVVWNACITHKPDLVAVEAPIVGASRNLRVGVSLGMVAGAICSTVMQTDTLVTLVPPASWKKGVVGFGNADKQQVSRWLEVHHPIWHSRCTSQDTIDSVCLALYAEIQVDR